jgi:1-acyl-sn-glycerol-3-phosphate acyltransferase
MVRRLRGVVRLTCFVAVTLHCAVVFAVVFPFVSDPRRMVHVGRFSARMLYALGLTVRSSGEMGAGSTLLVANHVSWLDILAINAVQPVRFVSKADVRGWPLVGWIVACGGTLFIERERRSDAMRVVHQVADALRSGGQIAIFPEGTTSDGRDVRPFHASLLQAAVTTGVSTQPVMLRFSDASESFSLAAPYIGDMTLMQSLWSVANARQLTAHVNFLSPLSGPHADRRSLGEQLRGGIVQALVDAQAASA